jgi:DNA-binding response OmpR family regulator
MKIESARILIVDGESLLTKDLEQALAGLGYRVAGVVNSGSKAVQAAEEIRPDLALVDIELGRSGDSLATANEIRDRLKIPIVFLMPKASRYADVLVHSSFYFIFVY